VNNFPEKLRQAMHEKRCKSADVARATGIAPSLLSRYLSGSYKPSSDNIITISHYLNVSPEWLLSSSDAPQPIQKSQVISSVTDPLLKTIEVQDKLIEKLENEVDELKATAKENEECHEKIKELEEKLETTTKLKNELLENLSRRDSQ
jgi:transcriptional regulator with XRE-family HTH domain